MTDEQHTTAAPAATPPPPPPPPPAATTPTPKRKRAPKRRQKNPLHGYPPPPGLGGWLANWMLSRATVPIPHFAYLAMLEAGSFLVGRKCVYENLTPVLHGCILGWSSEGKQDYMDAPKKVFRAAGVDLCAHYCTEVTGDTALCRALADVLHHPVLFAAVKDSGNYIRGSRLAAEGKGPGGADTRSTIFIRLWDESDDEDFTPKRFADGKPIPNLCRPSFTQLIDGQPDVMGRCASSEEIALGFWPRVLTVMELDADGGDTEPDFSRKRMRLEDDGEEGAALARAVRNVYQALAAEDKAGGGPSTIEEVEAEEKGRRRIVWRHPVEFVADEAARAVFAKFVKRMLKQRKNARKQGRGLDAALYGKAAENSKRVALVLAALRHFAFEGEAARITMEEAEWAVGFVERCVQTSIWWADRFLSDGYFEQDWKQTLSALEGAKRAGLRREELSGNVLRGKMTRDVDAILDKLVEMDRIRMRVDPSKGGRRPWRYWATPYAPADSFPTPHAAMAATSQADKANITTEKGA